MVEALPRPARTAAANSHHARLSVSPRDGSCSQHQSLAQLQGQQVASVSLGKRLSHLRVQGEDS